MLIGIDARIVEHRNFGITRYAENLIKNLSVIDKKNIYNIYSSKKGIKHLKELKLGTNFILIKTLIPLYFPLEHRLFSIILEKNRPDIFHSLASLVPSRRICPSIVTMHDIIVFKFNINYLFTIERLYHKSAIRRAAHVLTVSKTSKFEIASLFAIDKAKITYVYNGVRKFMLPKKSKSKLKYILYVGSVQKYKNVEMLIRAFDIVRKDREIGLVLVVHDTLGLKARDYIKGLLKIHGISGKGIHIMKNLSDEKLGKLYADAEVFVFPSIYEGFGLPIIEAMAHGTPVITSDMSCMPEITAGAAINVNMDNPEVPARAIIRVLNNPELKRKLHLSGIKRARFFKWRKCALETLEVYKRVYNEKVKNETHIK